MGHYSLTQLSMCILLVRRFAPTGVGFVYAVLLGSAERYVWLSPFAIPVAVYIIQTWSFSRANGPFDYQSAVMYASPCKQNHYLTGTLERIKSLHSSAAR